MGHPKAVTNRYYSKDFKLKVVQQAFKGQRSFKVGREEGVNANIARAWTQLYIESGAAGLGGKKRPGNPLAKYTNRKELTEVEKLRYELAKAEIEIAKLKKLSETGRRNARQKR